METGIGKRIALRRKELGLSQQELAERMGLKSKSTVCKVENGDDNLTLPIIMRYANALETTPEELAGLNKAKTIVDIYKNFPDSIQNDPNQAESIMRILNTYLQLSPDLRSSLLKTLEDLQGKF